MRRVTSASTELYRGQLAKRGRRGHGAARCEHRRARLEGSSAALSYAREVGGPALRALTFHERANQLKALAKVLGEHKEEFYQLSYATGATQGDSWIDIDGGISTLFVYASKGTRELPNSHVYVEGGLEALSKGGSFLGQHICVPLEGAAVHINAFNCPVWGMLEKLAPALLAGMPAIVKPATQTSYLTECVFRRIIALGVAARQGRLPADLRQRGQSLRSPHPPRREPAPAYSKATALKLRQHPLVLRNSVRFTAETDSLNSCILGPDAAATTPEFELFVREVVREMTVKAGQKCTAIRKALVPAPYADEAVAALSAALGKVVVGDPRLKEVRMGPVASLSQRREVLEQLGKLRREADVVFGEGAALAPLGADAQRGAFLSPTLLLCRDTGAARQVHAVEAFGPVCTLMPYRSAADAIGLARRGGGSLVASVFRGADGSSRLAQAGAGLASSITGAIRRR